MPADERPTPRTTGSFIDFHRRCRELGRLLSIGTLAYAKRPDLGHDYAASHRCSQLADRADLLADGFASWAEIPPDDAARGRDIDALVRLQEEAGPYLKRLGASSRA